MWTRVGSRNHVLDGVQISMRKATLRGKDRPLVKYGDLLPSAVQKTAEAIEVPFGVWTRMGRRKHVLDGVHIGTTSQMRLNSPCAVAMRPFVKLLKRLQQPHKLTVFRLPPLGRSHSALITLKIGVSRPARATRCTDEGAVWRGRSHFGYTLLCPISPDR